MSALAPEHPIRVVVWGENRHEQVQQNVRDLYPDGMHTTIKEGIEENLGDRAVVTTATLDDPEHGLTEEVLAQIRYHHTYGEQLRPTQYLRDMAKNGESFPA